MATIEQITPVVESKLKEMGLELFEIRFFHAGSRSILRVTIDNPDGVSISDCERVSSELSLLLDAEDFAGGAYSLEVSSPGIDRPLKTERDYRRIIGRSVVVHMHEGVAGKKTLRGEVINCESNKLTLKNENKTVEIPLSDIYSGKEEIRFK